MDFSYSKLYYNFYGDQGNVGGYMFVMLFWTVMYFPLIWYIEKINPGEYGAAQPFYFPFMVQLNTIKYVYVN